MCRNTCICCEDWECCKCRCCSKKNPKVVDKSSYDRRMAGQLFSQSPRAVDRRQRNVNERGLTILEHHGKDHKDHYEEEIYFNMIDNFTEKVVLSISTTGHIKQVFGTWVC